MVLPRDKGIKPRPDEKYGHGAAEPRSALPLFVPRVCVANHPDHAMAANDLAIAADALDGCLDLHVSDSPNEFEQPVIVRA